jgi:hypothetical protein
MRHKHKDKGRLPAFVPMFKETITSPAWRALSHGARSLFLALKFRYNSEHKNNGKIYLSTRDAAAELGSNRNGISRWFRELQHYGFVVMTGAGCLGVDGRGKAPQWLLTELGHMGDPPTRDFLRWKGDPFPDRFRPWEKQNPGAESASRAEPKVRPLVEPKVRPLPWSSGAESASISSYQGGAESASISKITTYHLKKGAAQAGREVERGGTRDLPPSAEPEVIDLPDFLPRRGSTRAQR